jgi:superfamily II DNA or RNA helicase
MEKKIYIIEKEIYDILRAIKDDEQYSKILDSYEDYNKSMLDFLKSKDEHYFKLLFKFIISELKRDLSENELKKELLEYHNINKHIVNRIIEVIFHPNIYSDKDSDIDTDTDSNSDTDTNTDSETEFKWRKNQIEAIDNTIKQDFKSGVHSQIMGAGKTYIILNIIEKHYEKYPNNKIYVITCFRQEILKDLFFDEDNKICEKKSKFLKDNNIIDLEKYNIIDRVNIKKKKIDILQDKPNILIINTDYFKTLDDNKSINYDNINFVILDECHSVSADQFYELLKKIKYTYKKHIIGFSATPLRAKSELKLLDIFCSNFDKKQKIQEKKLNIISNYDFLHAIKDDIILPPYYILCELNQTLNDKLGSHNKEIMRKVLEDTSKLVPYNKPIGWCRTIEHMQEYYDVFKKSYPEICCSSCSDNELKKNGYNTDWRKFYEEEKDSMLLCVNRCREGSDIKNLDMAIYLDGVQKRSLLVSLQTMGRVLRKDKEGKKTCGYLIDSYVNEGGIQPEVLTAQKIIEYYEQIFSLCDDETIEQQSEIYNEMKKICNNVDYDEKNKLVVLKLDTNEKHNVKFKFNIKSFNFLKLKEALKNIVEKKNVEKDVLKQYDFTFSKILSCFMNGDEKKNLSYNGVIKNIFNIINDRDLIKKNTSLNIKIGKIDGKGFDYISSLDISIQGVDANIGMKEIVNQCKLNEIDLKMNIDLNNGQTICVEILNGNMGINIIEQKDLKLDNKIKKIIKRNTKKKEKDGLNKYCFSDSKIISFYLFGDKISSYAYRDILLKIYDKIGDGKKIIENTILNIADKKEFGKGFYYIKELGISIQGFDSNRGIKEIIKQCQKNDIDIKIKIKLKDGLIIDIKYEYEELKIKEIKNESSSSESSSDSSSESEEEQKSKKKEKVKHQKKKIVESSSDSSSSESDSESKSKNKGKSKK